MPFSENCGQATEVFTNVPVPVGAFCTCFLLFRVGTRAGIASYLLHSKFSVVDYNVSKLHCHNLSSVCVY